MARLAFNRQAQIATYNKLRLLFNIENRDAYKESVFCDYKEQIAQFCNDPIWRDRVETCCLRSELDAIFEESFHDEMNDCSKNLLTDLLVCYSIRYQAGQLPSIRHAMKAADTHNPFNMLDMGNKGAHIVDIYANHIVRGALDTLVSKYNFSKRSALSLTGYIIGSSCNIAMSSENKIAMHAYVDPQRGTCASDEAAVDEFDYI